MKIEDKSIHKKELTKYALKAFKRIEEEEMIPGEESHIQADNILCYILRELGYDDVVDAYHSIDKWYC